MQTRGIIVALVVSTAGCTLFGSGKGSGKARPVGQQSKRAADGPDDDEDEEAGVRAVGRILRKFKQAVVAKDFDTATQLLARAQKRIRDADDVTRSHPDFEDIERLVGQARNRLEVAIEEDRIERRNRAIDDLMTRGNRAVAAGNALYVDLSQRVAQSKDVASLKEVLLELSECRAAGSDFLSEERYAQHAAARDQRGVALETLLTAATWQVKVSQQVGEHVEVAYQASLAGKQARDLTGQIEAFHKATVGFKACVRTLADLEMEAGYDAARLIRTRLGALAAGETKRRCLQLETQSRGRVDELAWRRGVGEVVARVDAAMSKVLSPGDLDEELQATQEAIEVLAACAGALRDTHKDKGHDRARVFDTLLGKLSAVSLARSCGKERELLVQRIPQIQWRQSLDGLQARLTEVADAQARAEKSTDAEATVTLWETVVEGLNDCVQLAQAGARRKGADKRLALETVWGALTIGAVEARCKGDLAKGHGNIKKAMARREVERFAAEAKGDERDVIRREGIPTRVDNYRQGRVFIYETKDRRGRGDSKRFGFDSDGKQTDFWAEWRTTAGNVAEELARVLGAIGKAATATELAGAMDAALPVLQVCGEVLTFSKESPGYDAKASFKTPLGTLTSDKLIAACAAETARLRRDQDKVRWRMGLEQLGERLTVAKEAVDAAATEKDPDGRMKILSRALGAMQECTERAGALPKSAGADLRYKVKTVEGTLDSKGMLKACRRMHDAARRAADLAVRDKNIARFIQAYACQADEPGVVLREGVPQQIQTMKRGGRVFVYAAVKGKRGKKARRFAFDQAGKRADEKLLSSQAGGPDKTVDVEGFGPP